jgi:hypothetical protein
VIFNIENDFPGLMIDIADPKFEECDGKTTFAKLSMFILNIGIT